MSNTIQLLGQSYNANYHYEGLTTISELQSYLTIADINRYSRLKADIEKNGINDPILYYKTANGIKLVIDGHVRLKACIYLKISDIPTKEIKENFETLSDIQFWIVKNQCQRRNLTQIHKIQLACLHEAKIQQAAKDNLVKAGKGNDIEKAVDTLLEIAKIANVGRTTVARYKKVTSSGLEDIIQKMITEDLSISSAYKQVQKSIKNGLNKTVKAEVQEDDSVELGVIEAEAQEPKYVLDYHAGRHLLTTNEVEYFIMAKDETKVKDFVSKQHNVKYAVLIIED
ncbi:ParB N-terminal domain-containing protein [Chryseobacterium sp. RG1]|uniref:ParB N-terminal domain-containing protein n=1 Tax=Chryseobacterium tagetis TaxID=2801334 RepID=A0ABS8A6H9_9FLAO|nr:ParB N-terminal domain-containing protein [Chryseobacterium tagetis]MCA6069385.1 ParB N-terminal domain-containing protein [Chryseobacterium tagetis]